METAAEVVIVGGVVTDRVSYYPDIPNPGEQAIPTHVKISRGGKGANMSVMATKLGARTALVSKIGDDDYGKMHLDGLRECGVYTDYIDTSTEVSTDMVEVAVAADGRNRIDTVSRECMYLIKPKDIENALSVIQEAKVMGCILEPFIETSITALKLGRNLGLTTLFNAAPKPDPSLSNEVFLHSDIFFCNEVEAEAITGLPCHSIEETNRACECLLERGSHAVIITLGHRGCVFADLTNKDPIHLPTKRVQAVDSTGASDAFFGALCYYYARFPHLDLQEKIRRCMEIATISVMREGTQSSYPWASELPQELLS